MNMRCLKTTLLLFQLFSAYTHTNDRRIIFAHGGAQPPTPPNTPPNTPPKKMSTTPTPATTPSNHSKRETPEGKNDTLLYSRTNSSDELLISRSPQPFSSRQLFPSRSVCSSDSEDMVAHSTSPLSENDFRLENSRLYEKILTLTGQVESLTKALNESEREKQEAKRKEQEAYIENLKTLSEKVSAELRANSFRQCLHESVIREDEADKRERIALETAEKLRVEEHLWKQRGCTFRCERPVNIPGNVPATETSDYHIRFRQPSASCIVGPCTIS